MTVPAVLALLDSPLELLIVVLIVVLLFGASKIPEMARNMGRAKAEFKRGEEEGLRQLERDRDDEEVRRKAREAGIATEGKTIDELRRELRALGSASKP